MVFTQIGGSYCPFCEFHCCPKDKDVSKDISRRMSHLKTLQLCIDERKNTIWEAIESDPYLFMAFEVTLRGLGNRYVEGV